MRSVNEQVLRDNLDENGSGDRNVKRRPVATSMIVSGFAVGKRRFWVGVMHDQATGPPWRADDRAACRRD